MIVDEVRSVYVWRVEADDAWLYRQFSAFYEDLAGARRYARDPEWRRRHQDIQIVRYRAWLVGDHFIVSAEPAGDREVVQSDGTRQKLAPVERHVEEEL